MHDKMLPVGLHIWYPLERRPEEEISLNIAYRWFCGFNTMDHVPDHFVFSQNRDRRFHDSLLFRDFRDILMNHYLLFLTGRHWREVVNGGSLFLD